MYARSTNIGNILNDFLSQLCFFFTQFLLNFIQDNIDLNIKKQQQQKNACSITLLVYIILYLRKLK